MSLDPPRDGGASMLYGSNPSGYNLGTSRTGTRIASIIIYFTQNEVTPLMSACVLGSAATIRVLLEHGASVDCGSQVRDLQHAHTL